eukprot:CAMPEP_0169477854 /NCGR_PEP_ID=MMETSP1042-20121227/28154_1 /TAXON_ID=464988 /ORGANISM="Hemiselmis andersenii, Strain CCMP1180" /LENGTH=70 /DNA_ID=CAMNT_0009592263 /DNA_START=87 /DNA_END=296 /DNA_ORIENTATION=+
MALTLTQPAIASTSATTECMAGCATLVFCSSISSDTSSSPKSAKSLASPIALSTRVESHPPDTATIPSGV